MIPGFIHVDSYMRILTLVLLALGLAASAAAQSIYLESDEAGFAIEMGYALSTDHVSGFGGSFSYSPDARLEYALALATTSAPSGSTTSTPTTSVGVGVGYLIASQRDLEPIDLTLRALYQFMTADVSGHALTVAGSVSRTLTQGQVLLAPDVGFTFTPLILGTHGASARPYFAVNVGARAANRLGRDALVILMPMVSFSDQQKTFSATLGLVQRLH
jgi:hypothetical protein